MKAMSFVLEPCIFILIVFYAAGVYIASCSSFSAGRNSILFIQFYNEESITLFYSCFPSMNVTGTLIVYKSSNCII